NVASFAMRAGVSVRFARDQQRRQPLARWRLGPGIGAWRQGSVSAPTAVEDDRKSPYQSKYNPQPFHRLLSRRCRRGLLGASFFTREQANASRARRDILSA